MNPLEPGIPPPPKDGTGPPSAPSAHPLLAHLPRDPQGRPLLGPVTILAPLGRGSMGPVFHGFHGGLSTEVAVKIVDSDLVRDRNDLAERILQDLKKASGILHENLVQVLEAGREGPFCWAAMEFVRGESAAEYLDRRRGQTGAGLSPEEAFEIAAAVARGLTAAHQAGLVHRDIKPLNILIPQGDPSKAKLSDLGIPAVAAIPEEEGVPPRLIVGTPGYMAPEQAIDPDAAQPAMDIFAMGATLYELLTGQAPFRGPDPAALLRDTAARDPDPLPSWIRPGPRTLLQKCLEKDPSKRFSNADELLMALNVLRAAAETQLAPPEAAASPASPPEPPPGGPAPAPAGSPEEIQSALDFLASKILTEVPPAPPAGTSPPPTEPPAAPAAAEAVPFVVVPQWPEAPPPAPPPPPIEAPPPAPPPPRHEPPPPEPPLQAPPPEPPPPAEAPPPAPVPEEEAPPPEEPVPAPPPKGRRPILRLLAGVALIGIGMALFFLKGRDWGLSRGIAQSAIPSPSSPAPAGSHATLAIQPDPLELVVDGRPVDKTLRRLELPAGPHRLVAVFPEEARIEIPFEIAPGKPADLDVRGFEAIARRLEEQQRWAEAEQWYRRAADRPGSDEEKRRLEAALARVAAKAAEGRKILRILSDPPGAEVYLGDRKLGVTPLALENLPPGDQELLFKREGCLDETLKVRVEPGRREEWTARLKARTGRVRVRGLKAGDRVRCLGPAGDAVREAVAEGTEADFPDLPEAEYEVVVERKAHEPAKWRVRAQHGKVEEIAVLRLVPRPGSLRVESRPPGAEIHLDGQKSGAVTPHRLEGVGAGPHSLRLVHPDCSDWEGTAEVRPEEETSLEVPLPPLAELRVETHPPGAVVTGAAEGRTPLAAKVKAGRRSILVREAGAGEMEYRWEAEAGRMHLFRVDLWERRARELERSGRWLEAAQAWRNSIAEGREDRAAELERKGRYEAAMKAAAEALDRWDWTRAEAAAEEALAVRPGDPEATALKRKIPEERERRFAQAMDRAGRALEKRAWKEALAAYQDALRCRPDDEQARSGLAEARRRRSLDVLSFEEIRAIGGHPEWIHAVVFSPDGKTLASGSNDRTARLWDPADGKEIRSFRGHSHWVIAVAFSPDGTLLATASNDRSVRLWDAASGKEVLSVTAHDSWASAVAFSPDGKTLVSGGGDHLVRFWDVATGQEIRSVQGHSQSVWSVAYSPDGSLLASAGGDGTIRLWDAPSREPLRVLRGHGGPVMAVSFGPDGRWLASGSQDGTARLWESSTGRILRVFAGHRGSVSAVAFRPDGKVLASAGADSTIRLWDTESGREIRALEGHRGPVFSLTFSPDGRRLASAGEDRTLRLWGVPD